MLNLIYFSWTYLDVEVAPLVRDLEDLWPGEAIDPQTVPVDEQPVGTHTEHDVNSLGILGNSEQGKMEKPFIADTRTGDGVLQLHLRVMQVHAIHGELLGVFEEVHLCLGWTHSPAARMPFMSHHLTYRTNQSRAVAQV